MRLTAEGRWTQFRNARETHRAKGLKGNECWFAALRDCDSHGYPFSHIYPPGITIETVSPRSPKDILEPPAGMTSSAAAVPPPPRVAVNIPKKPVATKEMYAGKPKPSHRQVVEWVAEHMHLDGVKPEDAPSGTAWGMLQFVKAGMGAGRSEEIFWGQIYPKLMPSQSELKYLERMNDAGDTEKDALDAFERAERERQAEISAGRATVAPAQQPGQDNGEHW